MAKIVKEEIAFIIVVCNSNNMELYFVVFLRFLTAIAHMYL